VTGLDTHVLVRYLTEDDAVQSKRAADVITTATAKGDRCFISAVVLCEMAWVLRGAYRVSQTDLILTLDRILSTTQFVVGNKDVVRQALDAYRSGRADFADYVIEDRHLRQAPARTRRVSDHLSGAHASARQRLPTTIGLNPPKAMRFGLNGMSIGSPAAIISFMTRLLMAFRCAFDR
jgi:predicted nucleic-acid-binding protein